MAPEPLSYATFFARRGQLLARMGRGNAGEGEERELAGLRASAATTGLRMDVLGEALQS